MAGIADLLYLGQPDPNQQIAQALSGQQPGGPAQGAGPPGANPLPPNGPAPTNAPDPNAPPSPGNPPPNGPQQPMAYQSSPDMSASYAQLASPQANNLMSLYLRAYERDRAEDQINHGLALIAANYAGNPGSARAIMQSADAGRGDAGGMVNNLMQIYGFQQQQQAMQSMLAQAPAIAQKLGMDEGIVRSTIMAGRGSELVQALEPTTATRDIEAKHDMFIKNGGTEEDWKTNYLPFILTGGAGGGDATTQSWRQERIRWNQENPGQPYPWGQDDPQSFALWKTKQNKLDEDQTDALQKRQPYVQNLTDLRNSVGGIVGLKPGDSFQTKDDGSLDTGNLDPAKYQALQHALNAKGAQAYLSSDPKDWTTQNVTGSLLTDEDKKVLDDIRSATNPKAIFGSVTGRAPRRSQSDVAAIGSNLEDMRNLRRSPDDWLGSVAKTVTAADTATGNAYGASGEAENAPDYTKEYIDPSYLKGGSMYPYGKKAQPMTPDQIAQAQAQIKANPNQKDKIIKIIRANNFDATPLQ
jgi:hypothetical protein